MIVEASARLDGFWSCGVGSVSAGKMLIRH